MKERRVERQGAARARIIDAAARLLHEEGPQAVTTRAVADRAGVQPPAIYRLFGDKEGLLDAVAEHVMMSFASTKVAAVEAAAVDEADPLRDLRDGWDAQITFGLANPALFRLLSDPARVVRSPGAQLGRRALERRVHRVAISARLRVSEPRAVAMIHAAGIGAIQTLLATAPEDRDPGLAAAMYEAVLAQILADPPAPSAGGPLPLVVALRALTCELHELSEAERQLLRDWLDRVISLR